MFSPDQITAALAIINGTPGTTVTWDVNDQTQTLKQWFDAGNDEAVRQIFNDAAVGASLNKTVSRASILRTTLIGKLAEGPSFVSMDISKLEFYFNGNDTIPLTDAGFVAAIGAAVSGYTAPGDVADKWAEAVARPASIGEAITGVEHYVVSLDDISQLHA